METIIQKTKAYMKEKQLGETTGHDWWHTDRVHKMARRIARQEAGNINMNVVELAALLHDIEDWKFNDGDETAGPRAAKAWLSDLGVSEDIQDHVADIIIHMSFKGNKKKGAMKTIEGQIVQDADRLDAIGAIGLARMFAYGGNIDNEIFNPEITPRLEMNSKIYKDKSIKSCSFNHMYEKLFFLKELMNTKTATEIAQERHDYLLDFAKRFLEESEYTESVHYDMLEDFMK